MAESVSGLMSGWPQSLWLVGSLVTGFAIVLVVFPVYFSLGLASGLVYSLRNPPFQVFLQWCSWIASDMNHVYVLILFSILVGFFARVLEEGQVRTGDCLTEESAKSAGVLD